MAFKITAEEFQKDEKAVEIIPGLYGICVCLKICRDDKYHLIKYENLARSNVAKTLAIYLTKENPALCHIYVRDKVYDVPKNEEGVREFAEIRETFQKFLESLDD